MSPLPRIPQASPALIQRRLLSLAAIFLIIYAVILTLSPAARERSWNVDYRWSHWVGLALWLILFGLAHYQIRHRLPDADPYLLPLAALLSGWGLLTVWRLAPAFGLRQTLWLFVSGGVLILGLRLTPELRFLRRYKYLWLTGGLLLTALTLVFGTNPTGAGPRLWLGCCGVYFQPSEPLKLLLIVYLAAYFADHLPLGLKPLHLLLPTAVVTGIALLLLIVQRDLGTATIFIFLYTIILYIAYRHKRILLASLIGMLLAGLAGYFLFDVVRLRVDAWLNPWLDPSGRSYQIVQSLLAVASGGMLGRGPGLGNPGLVPVAISDFVFSAIAEEAGLAGTIGLIALIGLFSARGMKAALHAPDRFRRLLAAGLTAYLGAQSILIIGGNLRLLPLTGVTLPFVSYGGSSLLTSFLALLILLLISNQADEEPAPLPRPQPYLFLGAFLGLGLCAAALVDGWWAAWRGPALLTRTDNARRSISDRYVRRGSILDQHNDPITLTQGESGNFLRVYLYPDLAPITGYTHPTYGQAGLEASLDPYLRGLQGNLASLIWWNHLLYGQPPPGLDVRLSLDLDLQRRADMLLGDHAGAIILLNAESGEILVMASHPTYDPNLLDTEGPTLSSDPDAPLVNRAAQGMYPPGEILGAFIQAAALGEQPSSNDILSLFELLGFYTAPDLFLPVTDTAARGEELRVSPLQMALAASALSHEGIRPPPRLAMAINTPQQGWVILPPLSDPVSALPLEGANAAAESLMAGGELFWHSAGQASQNDKTITWYTAGTLPDWQGTPLALVVTLEEDNPLLAEYAGQMVLKITIAP